MEVNASPDALDSELMLMQMMPLNVAPSTMVCQTDLTIHGTAWLGLTFSCRHAVEHDELWVHKGFHDVSTISRSTSYCFEFHSSAFEYYFCSAQNIRECTAA